MLSIMTHNSGVSSHFAFERARWVRKMCRQIVESAARAVFGAGWQTSGNVLLSCIKNSAGTIPVPDRSAIHPECQVGTDLLTIVLARHATHRRCPDALPIRLESRQ